MPKHTGRNISLSLPRRFICDLVHFAKKVPSVPVEKRMNLADVAAARMKAQPRPSWCAIFTKAFTIVAAKRPVFRRAYLSFPTPHFYEHPSSVASIAVERRYQDEDAVFFIHFRSPDERPLVELDAALDDCKQRPIEEVGSFRRALTISRLPRPLRKFVWWFGLNVLGRKRANYLGTFGVSVYSSLGAASLHPLSPLTTTLNYGVIDEDGTVDVRLVYDHRVMDGATVARALNELEQVLQTEIVDELICMKAKRAG